jgi:Pvc16 N-terminal domain
MPIQAVTLAIRDLLEAALHDQPHIPSDSFDVYVGPPDTAGNDAELILFLLRITPNADLRNSERIHRPAKPEDPPERFELAVPLDLHYLVTGGSPANTNFKEALTRLGHAVRAIETGSPVSVPALHQDAVWLSLEPVTTEDLSRIWGLFPNFNCRTSFLFRASPVWIDPRSPAAPAPPVIFDRARPPSVPAEA